MKSKTVVIYQRKQQKRKAGQKNKPFQWRKKLGVLCLGLAAAGVMYFTSPFVAAHLARQKTKSFEYLNSQKIEKNEIGLDFLKTETDEPFPSPTPDPGIDYSNIQSFHLTIEKIGLISANVIPNIDLNDQNATLQALTRGLVHAQTTALPGQGEMIYIIGHSTNSPWYVQQLNALFYQIEQVEPGDIVKIELNGRDFVYHVFDKRIVEGNDTNLIQQMMGDDVLILQSCYPPGTAWKRLLLLARPSKMGALIY
jgi:LPXTG-site transpeptidase (sortase) family protein